LKGIDRIEWIDEIDEFDWIKRLRNIINKKIYDSAGME
jgi:hypothetical protein